MIARRDGESVRLISRRGLDWGGRFGAIVTAVEALGVRTCIIDGEAIVCDGDGLADFHLLRYRRGDAAVHLCAFDLLELDGRDLRGEPIETRKAELARLLDGCQPRLVLNAVFSNPQRISKKMRGLGSGEDGKALRGTFLVQILYGGSVIGYD
jgi:bifunctional non-homologous end joining protein LigD